MGAGREEVNEMGAESMEPNGEGMPAGRSLPKIEATAIQPAWGLSDDPNERIIVFRESPAEEEETMGIGYCSLQELLAFLEREGWLTSVIEY